MGVKWVGIGILDTTHTTTTNFEMSDYFCEILTNYLVLDIRSQTTQVRERGEVGQDRRVYNEGGELKLLKATIVMKSKRKLEWSSRGGGCIIVLTNSQNGTDLSSEESRDALRWCFDIPLQDPPLKFDGCIKLFKVYKMFHRKKGGIIGLCHNTLNKEWSEMYRTAHTPASVINEPKYMGL